MVNDKMVGGAVVVVETVEGVKWTNHIWTVS